MDHPPERPRVVKLSPEIGNPVGQGRGWPGWLLLAALVVLIVFVIWAQTVGP